MSNIEHIAAHIASSYSYEQVIQMPEFDALLGVTLPQTGTLSQIQKAQMDRMTVIDKVAIELLKVHNLMLQNVRAEGYKLVDPQTQVKVAVAQSGLKIKKELVKAQRRITHVRTDELSPEKKREQEDALAKLAGIGRMLKEKRAS